jgi:hypothetical protein
LDRITTRKQVAPKRTLKALNAVARDESQIFRTLLDGQPMIRRFSNPDIRNKLKDSSHLKDITDPRRQSAKVTRIFNRCDAPGLIAKIPPLSTLALNQTRPYRHDRFHSTARCPIPDPLHEIRCMR